MSPAVGLLLILVGVFLFTQTTVGGAVGRLLSYSEDKEPDGAGPRASAYTPSRKGKASRGKFVALLLSQKGDRYVFGGETSSEKNPNGYDCSEFIQWAMNRLGYPNFPDGSAAQIDHCKKIPVARAIRTRGAVLYTTGHIAVSQGNGKTIEARGSEYGVGEFTAKGRFTVGGLIPELS